VFIKEFRMPLNLGLKEKMKIEALTYPTGKLPQESICGVRNLLMFTGLNRKIPKRINFYN